MNTSVRNFVYDHLITTLNKHAGDSRANFKRDPVAAAMVSSIKNKTLILYADKDIPFINTIAGCLHQQITGSEIVKFEKSAHMINIEQPGRFNRVADSFLRKKAAL